jgi:hypothetical protein
LPAGVRERQALRSTPGRRKGRCASAARSLRSCASEYLRPRRVRLVRGEGRGVST